MQFETLNPSHQIAAVRFQNAILTDLKHTHDAPIRPQRGVWLRLLSEVLTLAGSNAEFLSHKEQPWSSATFIGVRHSIALSFRGLAAIKAGEALIAELPEHEFTIPNYLVADANITSVEHNKSPAPHMMLEIELLLLEDC